MTIIIIGAMDIEVEKLVEDLNLKKIDNKDIFIGKHDLKNIIVSKSGIGKVNSAINTQYLIDKYNPDYIINTGCAGSLTKEIKIMDIIISKYTTYHDFNPIRIMKMSTPDNGKIKADENLINYTSKIIKKLGFNYFVAPITCGDCFVTDDKQRNKIRSLTNACAVDMESASIAHTCKINNIPFVSIRTISDFADGNDDFEKEASYRSCEIVKELINMINK